MRLNCPNCGLRDRSEFTYQGAALTRPDFDAGAGAWEDYLHLRENPAGWLRERWYHASGCGAWLVVERHTVTHQIRSVEAAS